MFYNTAPKEFTKEEKKGDGQLSYRLYTPWAGSCSVIHCVLTVLKVLGSTPDT